MRVRFFEKDGVEHVEYVIDSANVVLRPATDADKQTHPGPYSLLHPVVKPVSVTPVLPVVAESVVEPEEPVFAPEPKEEPEEKEAKPKFGPFAPKKKK